MRLFLFLSLCLIVLPGCSTVTARKQQRSTAYASLSEPERDLVNHGRIQRGMDTNAVFIAWGEPSAVTRLSSASGPGSDLVWVYYGSRPVMIPRWVYLPSAYGRGLLDYSPLHYSERYVKGEVRFQDGRVVDWKRFQ